MHARTHIYICHEFSQRMIERTYRCQPHRRKQEQRDVVDRQTDRSRWGRQAPNRRAAPAAPKDFWCSTRSTKINESNEGRSEIEGGRVRRRKALGQDAEGARHYKYRGTKNVTYRNQKSRPFNLEFGRSPATRRRVAVGRG